MRKAVLALALVCSFVAMPAAAAQTRSPEPVEEGFVERLQLDSLGDIPWDAFVVGLSISAAVGAAGGVIYGGLRGPEED